MHRALLWGAIIVVLCVGPGCEKVQQMKQAAEQAQQALEQAQNAADPNEAGEQVGNAFSGLRKALGGGEAVQAVDFRQLKALLPSSLPDGLAQEDARGERGSQFGLSSSKAEGVYRSEDGQRRITITIQDMGSARGLGMLADKLSGFSQKEMESDAGYERTTTFRDYQATEAFRSYDQDRSHGSLQFLVAERFQVEVEGQNVPMEAIQDAAGRVDLAGLENLKDAGVGVDDGTEERIAEAYAEAQRSQAAADAGASASGTPAPTEPVAADDLKALLPEAVATLDRTEIQSSSQTAGRIVVTMAEATYADGERRLTLELVDYAGEVGSTGIVSAGYSWLLFDVDKESDSGYERTTEIDGYPALEKLERRGSSTRCEVSVIVGKRVVVKAAARNLSMEEVRAVLDQIDLQRVEAVSKASV